MHTDFLESLQHSWGKSPKQKAREKEYNAEYYRKHKEKWAKRASDIADYNVNNKDSTFHRYLDERHYRRGLTEYHEKDVAARRGAGYNNKNYRSDQMAYNEAAKAYDIAARQEKRNEYKEQEAARYANSTKGKIHKAVDSAVSNWKIGAAAISDSAKKGADFVKNLFK